jgi:hypothetical protein
VHVDVTVQGSEVIAPVAVAILAVARPATTPTAGSPNRLASAGVSRSPTCPPLLSTRKRGAVVTLSGLVAFSVMVLPVLRLVNETLNEPGNKLIMDPSAALRSLPYSLSAGNVSRILNPQYTGGKVMGLAGTHCHG